MSVPALPAFDMTLAKRGYADLRALRIDTLQVNVGKLCNQTCTHCHVDAGPTRTEIMTRETVDARCRAALSGQQAKISFVDYDWALNDFRGSREHDDE